MITFSIHTTMEVESEAVLDAFIQSVPLNSIQKRNIIEGEPVVDTLDESSFPGTSNTRHTFQVIRSSADEDTTSPDTTKKDK